MSILYFNARDLISKTFIIQFSLTFLLIIYLNIVWQLCLLKLFKNAIHTKFDMIYTEYFF